MSLAIRKQLRDAVEAHQTAITVGPAAIDRLANVRDGLQAAVADGQASITAADGIFLASDVAMAQADLAAMSSAIDSFRSTLP